MVEQLSWAAMEQEGVDSSSIRIEYCQMHRMWNLYSLKDLLFFIIKTKFHLFITHA